MLKDTTEIYFAKLPLTAGEIHFIIGCVNDGRTPHSEYIWATVCLKKQKMEVYYRAEDYNTVELVKEFDYKLNEEMKPIRQDIWKT